MLTSKAWSMYIYTASPPHPTFRETVKKVSRGCQVSPGFHFPRLAADILDLSFHQPQPQSARSSSSPTCSWCPRLLPRSHIYVCLCAWMDLLPAGSALDVLGSFGGHQHFCSLRCGPTGPGACCLPRSHWLAGVQHS